MKTQRALIVAAAATLITLLGTMPTFAQDPPIAEIKPKELVVHDHTRIDDYYWLRERENPEVIAYLEAENTYTEARTADMSSLAEDVFEEMKARIKQDDESVPYRKGAYWYYTKYVEGGEYPIYARRQGSLDAPEEVMLDVNQMAAAAGTEYFQVSGVTVSPDTRFVAYGVDTVGRRKYTLQIKDLATGELLADAIPNVTPNVVWANDNATLFYVDKDPQTLRAYRVYRHRVGSEATADELVFEETDEEFSVWISRTKSEKYILLNSWQTLSTETRFLDADEPEDQFRVLQGRESDHEYSVDHHGDYFYIHTNRGGATNFKLVRAPINSPGGENWEEVLPHRGDTYLAGFELFDKYLVVTERREALVHMQVRPWDGEPYYLEFDEPAYSVSTGANFEFDTELLRFTYTSLTTPRSTFDHNMATRERMLLKEDEVLGGFDKRNYRTERMWAKARDGASIPLSIVRHKDTKLDGSAPLMLYAYGSYGSSTNASFVSTRLSLLDRGFVYAIAHIRGGQEMGRQWYDDGKLFNKKNTFTDFIDAADFLADGGYVDGNRVFARGGSAGGLLMGAVVNMRPDRWSGVVAAVPFVDVVTTMLDDTIPLTTFEYDEWGNPNEKDYYDYMLSYSPYDQVEAKDYPNLLVTTGLHDSQVQYWEPAKWVAKMRALKTDENLLLLKTNMEAGHGGASGRFRRLEERAFEYAFVLNLAGSTEILDALN